MFKLFNWKSDSELFVLLSDFDVCFVDALNVHFYSNFVPTKLTHLSHVKPTGSLLSSQN